MKYFYDLFIFIITGCSLRKGGTMPGMPGTSIGGKVKHCTLRCNIAWCAPHFCKSTYNFTYMHISTKISMKLAGTLQAHRKTMSWLLVAWSLIWWCASGHTSNVLPNCILSKFVFYAVCHMHVLPKCIMLHLSTSTGTQKRYWIYKQNAKFTKIAKPAKKIINK